jgi:hypothetical protein
MGISMTREQHNTQVRLWAQANPDKIRAIKARFWQRHPERFRLYNKTSNKNRKKKWAGKSIPGRRGAAHFFTGKPCHRGHICGRYVSTGQCVLCQQEWGRTPKQREQRKLWAIKNQKTLKARLAKWYKQNKKLVAMRVRAYERANPEKRKKWQRQYYRRHHKKLCEKNNFYHKNNPEKSREAARRYRKNHADRLREQRKRYNLTHREQNRKRNERYRASGGRKRYFVLGALNPQGEIQWLRKLRALLRTSNRIALRMAHGLPLTSIDHSAMLLISSMQSSPSAAIQSHDALARQ